jgi:hypothetical protein
MQEISELVCSNAGINGHLTIFVQELAHVLFANMIFMLAKSEAVKAVILSCIEFGRR